LQRQWLVVEVRMEVEVEGEVVVVGGGSAEATVVLLLQRLQLLDSMLPVGAMTRFPHLPSSPDAAVGLLVGQGWGALVGSHRKLQGRGKLHRTVLSPQIGSRHSGR
jgi:hypothetical protein